MNWHHLIEFKYHLHTQNNKTQISHVDRSTFHFIWFVLCLSLIAKLMLSNVLLDKRRIPRCHSLCKSPGGHCILSRWKTHGRNCVDRADGLQRCCPRHSNTKRRDLALDIRPLHICIWEIWRGNWSLSVPGHLGLVAEAAGNCRICRVILMMAPHWSEARQHW